MFCVPPKINAKLRTAIDSGKLSVEKLLKGTPEERTALLEKYVGDKYASRIEERFARKFHTSLTKEQTKDIIDSLALMAKQKASASKVAVGDFTNKAPQWARTYAELQARMEKVVNPREALPWKESIRGFARAEYRRIMDKEGIDIPVEVVKSIGRTLTAPVYKSLKASMDLSYALRQGYKVLIKSPKQWVESMGEAFQFIKAIKSQKHMDELMIEFKARTYSHPNYEKLVVEGKTAIGIVEDWFPTHVAEKIPFIGNIFKTSNDAFTVFSQSARLGIADDMYRKQVQLHGRELSKMELESIGYVANSVTGRGSLGGLEAISGHLNRLFFSARYISSQVDTFTMGFKSSLSKEAKKEARIHSLKVLSSIGALMTTASFFTEVEFDPRSSRFGKMKVGDNWVDLTAGIGSYIVLASKQATGKFKTTSTGQIKDLNSGLFGSQTRTDVAVNWFTNKLAPAPGTVNQVWGKGELYGGVDPTPFNVAVQLLAPISSENIPEYFMENDAATALLISTSEILGMGVTPERKK